jgi:hypothetical protein
MELLFLGLQWRGGKASVGLQHQVAQLSFITSHHTKLSHSTAENGQCFDCSSCAKLFDGNVR